VGAREATGDVGGDALTGSAGELTVDVGVQVPAVAQVGEGGHVTGTRRVLGRFPGMTGSTERVTGGVPGASRSDAFERYVLPEIEVLLRVARSLTGNTADAEDLVQDTLVRAYRSIDRFDGRHPRAWLLTILRRTHINRNRRRRPELLCDPDSDMDRLAAADGEPAEAAVDAAFDAEVEAALVELTAPFRQTVELVDIGGLSYREAAQALGVPVGTVMSRLHRARARIRDQLALAGVAPRSP
jgi:RNA polymerase sigma-70 factor (ECF subfamily)